MRCAACGKLLFKVGRSSGDGLEIERSCRGRLDNVTCGLVNVGRVTDSPGKTVADSLSKRWKCTECGYHLARVHPVKGRVAVRCRCGAKVGVTAADAIRATRPPARAS